MRNFRTVRPYAEISFPHLDLGCVVFNGAIFIKKRFSIGMAHSLRSEERDERATNEIIEKEKIMKQKRLLSILTLAGAGLTFSAGPIWTQTTPTPGKSQTEMKDTGERTGEEKMKARGTQDAERTERKKGEEEMEARGAQKPGRMGRGGDQGMEGKQGLSERRPTQDVRKAQEALKNKGHDPGSIDGIIGPQTQQAIRAFQNASGLKETGRLDAETANKLGVEEGVFPKRKTFSKESTPKQKEPSLPTGK